MAQLIWIHLNIMYQESPSESNHLNDSNEQGQPSPENSHYLTDLQKQREIVSRKTEEIFKLKETSFNLNMDIIRLKKEVKDIEEYRVKLKAVSEHNKHLTSTINRWGDNKVSDTVLLRSENQRLTNVNNDMQYEIGLLENKVAVLEDEKRVLTNKHQLISNRLVELEQRLASLNGKYLEAQDTIRQQENKLIQFGILKDSLKDLEIHNQNNNRYIKLMGQCMTDNKRLTEQNKALQKQLSEQRDTSNSMYVKVSKIQAMAEELNRYKEDYDNLSKLYELRTAEHHNLRNDFDEQLTTRLAKEVHRVTQEYRIKIEQKNQLIKTMSSLLKLKEEVQDEEQTDRRRDKQNQNQPQRPGETYL